MAKGQDRNFLYCHTRENILLHLDVQGNDLGKMNLGQSEMENQKEGVFAFSSRVSEICHIHHKAPRKEEGSTKD
jgi:hypothetical protein